MWTEQQWLRLRAIVLMRESGATFAAIGKRHGISTQRAWALYREATWPTDVMEEQRRKARARYG